MRMKLDAGTVFVMLILAPLLVLLVMAFLTRVDCLGTAQVTRSTYRHDIHVVPMTGIGGIEIGGGLSAIPVAKPDGTKVVTECVDERWRWMWNPPDPRAVPVPESE